MNYEKTIINTDATQDSSHEKKRRKKVWKNPVSILKKKMLTEEEAQARFDTIAPGQVIENLDRSEQYVFNTDYEWRQAWSDSKTLAHMQLPKYWFVNEIGDVISVAFASRPVYVTKDKDNKAGYTRYRYSMPNGQIKVITAQNLVGLVWDAPMTGEALYLLDTKGVSAFGTRIGDVNGHHVDGDINNSHWSNVEFIVKSPHSDMHKKKYQNIAHNAEVPTVIFTPYEYDKDGNFVRYDGHNSLREPTKDELSDLLSRVHVSEILIETEAGNYLLTGLQK